jgi:hypothetical protein
MEGVQVAFAMTRLLSCCSKMLQEPFFSSWPRLFTELIGLIQSPKQQSIDNEEDEIEDGEEISYHPSYSRLSTIETRYKTLGDPHVFLAQSLSNLAQTYPGKIDVYLKSHQEQLSAITNTIGKR